MTVARLASVQNLHVSFRRRGKRVPALRGVSLDIDAGEIVGLVGESGSGKSVLGLTLLGLLPDKPRPTTSGSALVKGVDMLTAAEPIRRDVRKHHLGAVFQDPMTSLNPSMRIGAQIEEVKGARLSAAELLDSVGLDRARERLRAYPHELSGGQRQRVMLAMAVASESALIIADEPTTALDVTVQREILQLIRNLRDEFGCSFLFVTHDLGVASEVSDRIAVLYAGRVAEVGSATEVLRRSKHPYSIALLNSRLTLRTPKDRPVPTIPGGVPSSGEFPPGCAFAPRCQYRQEQCDETVPDLVVVDHQPPRSEHLSACLRYEVMAPRLASAGTSGPSHRAQAAMLVATADEIRVHATDVTKAYRPRSRKQSPIQALRGINLEVKAGESVALVGASGCGKTTLLSILSGLEHADSGVVETVPRSQIQMVFQDAAASLTPWLTVESMIGERVRASGLRGREAREAAKRALQLVGLTPDLLDAKPRQLSGGQAQRVSLARAIAIPPKLILADEPTSALDVALVAAVLNLLGRLRTELSFSMVFVTHDIAAARIVADRIVVMKDGAVVEEGAADRVVDEPAEEYTQQLIAATPNLDVLRPDHE